MRLERLRSATLAILMMLSLFGNACRKRTTAELGLGLINAVREGSAGEVRDLIAEGASLSARDENGELLWRVALEHYNRNVWDVLTESNIDHLWLGPL